MKGQTDSFFRNDGGYFVDQTGAVGLGGTSRGFTRFGLGLADFDNDGVLDLYQANGGVVRAIEAEDSDPFAEANLLFRGERPGRFVEVLPRGGTSTLHLMTSRAAAFGDVDDDGGIDVLVVNRDGPAHLFRNVFPDRGHWVRFAVLDENERDALGARVTICVEEVRLAREVRAAFSYCASNDPRAHFGIGTRDRAEQVAVEWPDGAIEWFGDREADATYSLSRGSGMAASSLPTCAGSRTGS